MPSTHSPKSPTSSSQSTTGQPVELARYRADCGARILVGQRVDGIVRVTDVPDGEGPSFLVEPQLESKAALDALVADYLTKAKRLGYAPMHGWF